MKTRHDEAGGGRARAGILAAAIGGLPSAVVIILTALIFVAPASAIETEALLEDMQHTAFDYFWNEANASNGLVKDRSTLTSPCSIAAVGFGLSAICVGIDHGYVTRADGRARVLTTLNTFWTKPQGAAISGTIGYKGLYYHFLDMNTGLRTWTSELSTIDTALLFAGIIDAKHYFSTADPLDVQVRALADSITWRADWEFMRNGGAGVRMGWKPETGFNTFGNWIGYNEAMILYILALGSPTHPVPNSVWTTWTSGYNWSTQYGFTYINFPPLFGHQYSHCWIDFRSVQDTYTATKGITYFENSRRATLAQRAYCIANPFGWTGYGANLWGLTASDDPDGYSAHGAPPPQNDNGTITPTAPASSLPFAPEVVIPTLHNLYEVYGPQIYGVYGFIDAFNLSENWYDPDYLGIDQGPIVLMIENYRTQKIWSRFMQDPMIQLGLQRAGFGPATGVETFAESAPGAIDLGIPVPNPFRSVSRISYTLRNAGPVSLAVYDVRGRPVRRLADEVRGAGVHQTTVDGQGLPAGVYTLVLEANGETRSQKLVFLR